MSKIRNETVFRVGAMLLLFVGLIAALGMQVPETAAAPDATNYKILPIGDSNTVGFTYDKGNPLGCANEAGWAQYASYRYWLYDDLKKEGIAFQFTGSIDLSPDEEPDKDPTSTGNAFCPDDYKNRWVHVAESDQVRFIGWNSRTTVDMAGKNDGTCNKKIATIPGTSQDSNWCVPQGLGNLNPVLGSSDHAIALVHLGTNDLNKNRPWSESKPAFVSILEELRDKTPAQGKMTVLLATILPGDGDNDLDTTGVKDFNRNLQGLCTGTTPADQNKDEDLFLKCGGGEVPTGARFEVYLINMNEGFDIGTIGVKDKDFQKDDIHLINTANMGEDKMAQRWFAAIKKVVDGDNGGVETGTITVKKVVEDIGNGVGPVSEFDFEMTDQSDFSLSDGQSMPFSNLDPKTYTIAEMPEVDYDVSIACPGADIKVNGLSVDVKLAAKDDVTCTFTNTYAPQGYVQIDAGDYHVCALDSEGNVSCDGWDSHGQKSGDGGDDPDSERDLAKGGDDTYTQVSGGRYHTCAIDKVTGKVDCWGRDKDGQSKGNYNDTTHQGGGGGTYTQISAGGWHTCAIRPNGKVDCWGGNEGGQAEDQTDSHFTQVSAGWNFTCALKQDGSVKCWGDDTFGQASGNKPGDDYAQGGDGKYTQVSAGQAHTCAIKQDGNVDCWGFNGNENWRRAADQNDGPYIQVSAGGAHTCALKQDGTIKCWGKGTEGQTAVPEGSYQGVSAGRDFSCGLKTDDTVVCWGNVKTNVVVENAFTVWPGGLSSTAAPAVGPLAKFTFTITDQGEVLREEFYLANGESQVFGAPLPIGEEFTITQEPVDGYAVVIDCDGQGVVDGLSVAGTPVLNDTVTCTFTNTYVGPEKEDVSKADGESLAYTTNNTESNQNSSFDQADLLSIAPQGAGTAIKGTISPASDVDYFLLAITNSGTLEPGGGILFDVDADNGGSDLDAELCVYDGSRNLIGCNDDADGLDPMLYVPNCGEADLYYVEVRGYSGASTGDYVLTIDAELVIVSPERGGRVDDLRFDAEDILARTSITGPQYKWIKFFDASDLGIYKNIIAFDLLNSCPGYGADLAVTFTGKQRITDSTGQTWKSTRYDVVSIDVSQFGPASSGEFDPQLVLKGSEVGLTTRGERIDAITYMNGTLLVSMDGGANLPDGSGGTIQVQDEDLAYLVSGAPQPAWAVWFDGSTVPGLAPEDLYAASFDQYFGDPDEVLYYLIQGKGRVNGYPASQRILCVYEGPGSAFCQPSEVAPFNIDALD